MVVGSLLKRGLIALLLIFFILTVVGGLLGQPIGLTYVETGSMEPVMDPGDGYIAVPMAIAGPVQEGDVIAFDAVNLNDGELVTHRVVDVRERGYITKGDANPVTDQDGSEPPVTPGRVKAKALTVAGSVVVVPQIGTVVTGIGGVVQGLQQQIASLLGIRALLGSQGLAFLLLGFGLVTYIVSAIVEESGERNRSRQTRRETGLLDGRTIIVGMTVIMIIILTLAMAIPAGAHEFKFVSSQTDARGPSVIEVGSTENVTFSVPSNGAIPTVSVIESASTGISVNKSVIYVPSGEVRNITVSITAPPQTGSYAYTITENRYLALLPSPAIVALHDIHDWAPIVAINSLASVLLILITTLLIGLDPIRIGRRQPNVSFRVRLRRWLR